MFPQNRLSETCEYLPQPARVIRIAKSDDILTSTSPFRCTVRVKSRESAPCHMTQNKDKELYPSIADESSRYCINHIILDDKADNVHLLHRTKVHDTVQ